MFRNDLYIHVFTTFSDIPLLHHGTGRPGTACNMPMHASSGTSWITKMGYERDLAEGRGMRDDTGAVLTTLSDTATLPLRVLPQPNPSSTRDAILLSLHKLYVTAWSSFWGKSRWYPAMTPTWGGGVQSSFVLWDIDGVFFFFLGGTLCLHRWWSSLGWNPRGQNDTQGFGRLLFSLRLRYFYGNGGCLLFSITVGSVSCLCQRGREGTKPEREAC